VCPDVLTPSRVVFPIFVRFVFLSAMCTRLSHTYTAINIDGGEYREPSIKRNYAASLSRCQ
jgi:hypothetical protein